MLSEKEMTLLRIRTKMSPQKNKQTSNRRMVKIRNNAGNNELSQTIFKHCEHDFEFKRKFCLI